MVPTGARRKNLTHRWHSKYSMLAMRYQEQEATACAFCTCNPKSGLGSSAKTSELALKHLEKKYL